MLIAAMRPMLQYCGAIVGLKSKIKLLIDVFLYMFQLKHPLKCGADWAIAFANYL